MRLKGTGTPQRWHSLAALLGCPLVRVLISAACLSGCSEQQTSLGSAASAALPSRARMPASTATEAQRQNWKCQRIERAITDLVEPMRAALVRTEKEEEQMPQTLVRTMERLSGPPGAGNAAFAEFTELRNDADRLNDLLRRKRCAEYRVDIGEPAFRQRQ